MINLRFFRASQRHLYRAALLVAPAILGASGCDLFDDDDDDGGGVQCDSSAECAAGTFCNFGLVGACGAEGEKGTCDPIQAACTQDFTPVCGCDGMTYANACMANAASVSVASLGECLEAGDTCGGLLGASCGEGTFCNFPPDAACGAADQT